MTPDVVTAALWAPLHADATLTAALPGGVWSVKPPPGTAFPFMRLALQPSPDPTWTFTGSPILRLRYQLSVSVKGLSTVAADAALARADALLSDGAFAPASGRILSCRRQGFPGNTSEEVDGVPYQLVRAAYLVMAQ